MENPVGSGSPVATVVQQLARFRQTQGLARSVCMWQQSFLFTCNEEITGNSLNSAALIKRQLISRRNMPEDITRAPCQHATATVVGGSIRPRQRRWHTRLKTLSHGSGAQKETASSHALRSGDNDVTERQADRRQMHRLTAGRRACCHSNENQDGDPRHFSGQKSPTPSENRFFVACLSHCGDDISAVTISRQAHWRAGIR